jgi:hypothetical protein
MRGHSQPYAQRVVRDVVEDVAEDGHVGPAGRLGAQDRAVKDPGRRAVRGERLPQRCAGSTA